MTNKIFSSNTIEKTVLSLGVGGIAFHAPQSRSFAVALHPAGNRIAGIPVTHQWPFQDFWDFWFNPVFTGSSVTWY